MKVIAKPNESHWCKGEMIDLCSPRDDESLEVWGSVHVDAFHEMEPVHQLLRSGKTVELMVKGIVE